MLNVTECGTRGDGHTDDTAAIQQAIDHCGEAGGGEVLFPPGGYVSGPLILRSHVTLRLEPGATLLAAAEPGDFADPDDPARCLPLIGGRDLDAVGLVGLGTVDGRGQAWWDRHREARRRGKATPPRPHLVELHRCRRVTLRDLTFRDSPSWNLRPVACDDLLFDNLRVVAPPGSPNTDGINPDGCRNVRINACTISTGDDCITLKSGSEKRPADRRTALENVVITGCTLERGHGGIVFGSEMSGGIRNVAVANCTMLGTDRGLRFKTRRGRGNAITNVRITNLVMSGVGCPLVINMRYTLDVNQPDPVGSDAAAQPVGPGTPSLADLAFSHVTADGVQGAAALIHGLPESPVRRLTLDDWTVRLARGDDVPHRRPASIAGAPLVRGRGFVAEHARDLSLSRLRLDDARGPAVELDDSHDVHLDALTATGSGGEHPAVRARRCTGLRLDRCHAPDAVRLLEESA